MEERRSKINYYLDIAQTVTERGTCLRRRFGAIIVKDDVIVSTGYAGAPRGRKNCCDLGFCLREQMNIPRGERYELCRERMLAADLYMACIDSKTKALVPGTTSCQMCKRMIINAGIARVIVRDTADEYTVYNVADWVENDDSLGSIGY